MNNPTNSGPKTLQELSEEEMRKNPLTMAAFRHISLSAHAFWSMKLEGKCHPQAGTHATLHSRGAIEFKCAICSALIGVVAIQEK